MTSVHLGSPGPRELGEFPPVQVEIKISMQSLCEMLEVHTVEPRSYGTLGKQGCP